MFDPVMEVLAEIDDLRATLKAAVEAEASKFELDSICEQITALKAQHLRLLMAEFEDRENE